jgi:hypothetical protein
LIDANKLKRKWSNLKIYRNLMEMRKF